MAIARANKLGTTNNTGAGLSSLALTVTATTTAHNRVIVASAWGAADRTCTVSDSQGNSYTQDAQEPGGSVYGRIFSSRADTPLTSGVDQITITWTGGTVNDAILAAYEYSGIANFAPLDKTSVGQATGTSAGSGSVTTTYAHELIFGLIGWTTVGISSPAYTQLDKVDGSTHHLETQENIASSTGSFNVTATLQPTPSWVALMCTYADTATPSPPVSTTAPLITGSTVVGMQLTCSQGMWTLLPTAYSYQWKRDGSNLATGAHYLIVSADSGHTLSCVTTASNKYGSTSQAASNTVSV